MKIPKEATHKLVHKCDKDLFFYLRKDDPAAYYWPNGQHPKWEGGFTNWFEDYAKYGYKLVSLAPIELENK